jgi:hypothetical protein
MSSTPNWVFVPGHYVNMNKKENKETKKENKEEWIEVPVCGCPTQCGCPTVFKSRCWDFKKTKKCPRGNNCRFAHY